ncbi:5-bromo-4-chloroindolyl phosphate hydrolysis family protein [Metabacillus sp. GX 13764]|uniref:5-bromo-4-chloroindolyl phosphate hydrolysis family protein n=1 Tax=Metabacillus kandeliae TaxID=2900151 RepID=UPI001E35BB00|nr:5-bromo-4-chloroindolyl phosphate hydrolysis family protein [Metabacillus kandeliae]MCD7034066.1 5-bromo-4-chloroindolyl phosphate hydrolysis family protein [Metabacillus kandeliae]
MNRFMTVFAGTSLAIPVSFAVWLTSTIFFHQPFLIDAGIGLAGGAASYGTLSAVRKQKFLTRNQLSRKEYNFISKNLKEASKKIWRMNRALVSVRSVSKLRQRLDLIHSARKIHRLCLKEPKRFYAAEPFYYKYLDSAVELSEKYAFLSSHPSKTWELEESLRETSYILKELSYSIEKVLQQMIAEDVERLNFEMKVAKHSLKESFLDESVKFDDRIK